MPHKKTVAATPEAGYSYPDGTPVSQDVHERLAELTYMQAMYCLYYFAGPDGVRGNQYQSALAAGYSKATAASQASVMMRNPGIKGALDALRRAATDQAIISRTKLIEMAIEQAESWKDRDTGQPMETPLVAGGQIVIAEFVVRDSRGNIVFTEKEGGEKVPRTMKQPVVERARSNAANTAALKLAAELCGYLAVRGDAGIGSGSTDTVAPGDTPVTGYNEEQLPNPMLDDFLTRLPAPRDTGARTATAVPTAAVPAQA